jgi:uncharacterized protein (DUF3084 family)
LFQLLREMNWSLLLALVVVSAFVAWVGDIVGMKLGRKRITLFKIRPKYTSRLISVFTGVAIAIVTLFAISVASEPVRTALFNMSYVKNQIITLTDELQKNKDMAQNMEINLFESRADLKEKQDELSAVQTKLSQGTKSLDAANKELKDLKAAREQAIAQRKALATEVSSLKNESTNLKQSVKSLNDESARLKNGIQHLREGRIAAFSGEILAQGVISSKKTTDEMVDNALARLSGECQALLAYRFGVKPETISMPNITETSVKNLKEKLRGQSGRFLLRLTALTNAIAGEPVDTEASYYNTKLIYKNGTVLGDISFEPGMKRTEIEAQISRALKNVNLHATRDGILRDPVSGSVGTIDSAELANIVTKIVESKNPCTLKMSASRDIHTEGPVTLKLTLKEK